MPYWQQLHVLVEKGGFYGLDGVLDVDGVGFVGLGKAQFGVLVFTEVDYGVGDEVRDGRDVVGGLD